MQIEKILSLFKNRIEQRLGNRLQKIILFGSYARQEAKADSDIDIMLVYNNEHYQGIREISLVSDIINDFLLEFGVLISILPTSSKIYQSTNRLIYRNIKKQGILLV